MPRILLILAIALFSVIGVAAYLKKRSAPALTKVEEIAVEEIVEAPAPAAIEVEAELITGPVEDLTLPEANRIEELFSKREPKLPIVETITYHPYVPWKKGKAAWIADYASEYKTSRHFIARSLNGKPDYERQEIADGDKFNVLRSDKNFSFYLLVDVLTSRMWFYYVDHDNKDKVLIKSYAVGLGRPDPYSPSGTLTPLGRYKLGDKVGIYRPKMVQFHQGEKTEMVKVFGTRWVPFAEEVGPCTADAKGYGIHGLPWTTNEKGELIEDRTSLGTWASDGCIRLATEDMEELFSIIITRPTEIEIVRGFPKEGKSNG